RCGFGTSIGVRWFGSSGKRCAGEPSEVRRPGGMGEPAAAPPRVREGRSEEDPMAELVARTLALQIVTDVRAVVDEVARRDKALDDQMRRAAVSVISNLNEGARRKGKDRLHFWRISAGSADELMGRCTRR